ncbi:MAG TPA: twin-arginine translocase TatA/TatE family subunit [Candidatus Limnocylindria bacterium]|nr:twin-arginine translocase TatA/TatE family subunit [Candidatus Limnocylindria bacterium]
MGGLLEGWHPVVLLLVVLIVYGPGKLAEVAGQLGRGVREFREAVDDKGPDRPA